jgi:hypothetical protein
MSLPVTVPGPPNTVVQPQHGMNISFPVYCAAAKGNASWDFPPT